MNNIISAYQSDSDDGEDLSSNYKAALPLQGTILGYVSKRKRKHLADIYECTNEVKAAKPEEKSDILSFYCGDESKVESFADAYQVPRKKLISFKEHTAAVTSLDWHLHDHRLLLSSSMDHSVRVWDPYMQECCVANCKPLNAALQVSKWVNGHTAVCGGYSDHTVHMDMNTLQNVSTMKQDSFVTALKVHPTDRNSVIVGTYKSQVHSWDLRSGRIVNTYKGADGQILDLAFLTNELEMIASADIVKKNSSSETIVIWDYRSAVVRSNQVYQEPYTCPSLCVHPYEHVFVAQSNANYVVIFSARRPYKLNKFKRYTGHTVMGYRISVDISPCGSLLYSGDANGHLCCYNYNSSKMLSKLQAYCGSACIDCKFNRGLSSIATCSWDGQVTVWKNK